MITMPLRTLMVLCGPAGSGKSTFIAKRMNTGRLTIADTLSLHETARRGLLELARRFSYHTCLLVFNMSLQTCLLQNQYQARTHIIPEQMIAHQVQQLQQALAGISHEGWDQVGMLDEPHRDVEIEIASV